MTKRLHLMMMMMLLMVTKMSKAILETMGPIAMAMTVAGNVYTSPVTTIQPPIANSTIEKNRVQRCPLIILTKVDKLPEVVAAVAAVAVLAVRVVVVL
jgi:hypothetical protein